MFISAKDMLESMAAIQAAYEHGRSSLLSLKKEKEENDVIDLCIGDGLMPRIAILACFLKKDWDCVSIDPALREEWHGNNPKGVRGLFGYSGTLEDFLMIRDDWGEENGGNSDDYDAAAIAAAVNARKKCYDHLLLLCIHSHARLVGIVSVLNIIARYGNVPTTLILLPCCLRFRLQKDVGRVLDVHYKDDCVFSACQRVEIWNFR
jgi:hypothetical protein